MWLFGRREIRCDGVLDAYVRGDRIVLCFEGAKISLSQEAARMTLVILGDIFRGEQTGQPR